MSAVQTRTATLHAMPGKPPAESLLCEQHDPENASDRIAPGQTSISERKLRAERDFFCAPAACFGSLFLAPLS